MTMGMIFILSVVLGLVFFLIGGKSAVKQEQGLNVFLILAIICWTIPCLFFIYAVTGIGREIIIALFPWLVQ